jgi:hypothetical protein
MMVFSSTLTFAYIVPRNVYRLFASKHLDLNSICSSGGEEEDIWGLFAGTVPFQSGLVDDYSTF